jgi:type II secretory pathway pseudopilin PulG
MKKDNASPPRNGFTLIELLIVIACMMIFIGGEAKVLYYLIHTTSVSRDMDMASSYLSGQLAVLRSQGVSASNGKITFPEPLPTGPMALPSATGEITLSELPATKVVQANARLEWISTTGKREVAITTLVRMRKGEEQ